MRSRPARRRIYRLARVRGGVQGSAAGVAVQARGRVERGLMPFGRQRGRRSEASRWRLEAAVAVSSRHVRRLTRLGPGVGERSHMVGTALYIA